MAKLYMVVDRIEDITYQGKLTGKRVFDKDGKSVNVKGGRKGSALYERWDELNPDVAYEFEMGEFNGVPFVVDFRAVEIALAEKEIEKAPPVTPPPTEIAPQKEGMLLKEVGENYRMGKLVQLLGEEAAANAIKRYRGEILAGLRIPHDGKNLPPAKG